MNEFIQASDGSPVFLRSWSCSSPRGQVLLAHGAIDHSARYERLANALNNANFDLWSLDLRGHGRTAPSERALGRGPLDVWDRMVGDLLTITHLIKTRRPGQKLFLLGNSLGSLIVQDYLQRWGSELSGAILCGTFGHLQDLERLIEQLAPVAEGDFADQPSRAFQSIFARFNQEFQPDRTGCAWLSSNAQEIERFIRDPLCRFAYSNAFGQSILLGARRMWREENENRLPHDLPVLFLSGENDAAGEHTAAVLPLIARYHAHGVVRVDHHFFANTRHELFMEDCRDELFSRMVAWINDVCSS